MNRSINNIPYIKKHIIIMLIQIVIIIIMLSITLIIFCV